MIQSSWYKATLKFPFKGQALELMVGNDLFSSQQLDDGTRLLLENLPTSKPVKILDMGCGYGGLGIPVAAAYPDAQLHMVDRDLLAVRFAAENANLNRLANTVTTGGLGFDRLSPDLKFDWILCNLPARIGEKFMANLLNK